MLKASLRRSLIVLVLVLSTGSSVAQAAPSIPVGSLWSHLVDWMGISRGKHGCSIDPDGASNCSPNTVERETGRPTGTVSPKKGCSIDPDGKLTCAQ